MDYKESGVDRNAAYDFVEGIQKKAQKIHREESLGEIGDFGGFFVPPKKFKEPLLVATTDGVGTKLILAEQLGKEAHRAVGIDAVAMCVNDLLACRAEPFIFLDYLATGKLDESVLSYLMEGLLAGCEESNCALIGGETAQMPGHYPGNRYDVAGFSIGALERSKRFDRKRVQPGDIVVGFESSGFHSNGFSLVRRVLDSQNWKLDQVMEGKVLADALITPTRLYVRPILELFERLDIKAAAHITGGGLIENLPRGVDESNVQIRLNRSAIPTSSLMKRFVEAAKLSETESFCTWNMGIGFCLICSEAELLKIPKDFSISWHRIGQVEARSRPMTQTSVYLG